MSLLEQPLLCLLVVTVYGNLLQDKCWGQETGAVTVPTPRDPRHVGTQLTRLGVCHKLLPHCWVKLPTLLRFYNFIPPLKLIWLRFFFVFYKCKHQGLQIPPSKKNKQPKQPDEHIQIIQTTKRTTFNSLWRGQKEMVFWENVSDNANSTFSMESDRVEIKKIQDVFMYTSSQLITLEIWMQWTFLLITALCVVLTVHCQISQSCTGEHMRNKPSLHEL